MAVSPFDGSPAAALYGDPEIAAFFAADAENRAMLRVEGALAEVQGRLGIIPAASGAAIARAAEDLEIDPAELAAGMAGAGVPVAALVKAFRAALGPEHGAWLHWGATSQDVVDTGLVLRLAGLLEILDGRLARLVEALAGQAARHRDTAIAARTRYQIATPTTLGAKIAVWGMPLVRHRARLAEFRPRLLRVSLGGASGNNAALQGRGDAVMRALADALGLGPAEVPWHAARDAIAELGGWLSLVTGSLGKIGQDLILLGQSEVGEVTAGAGGGSSTMPHKANPVSAEALVTLARLNAGTVGSLHQALVAAQERDGVSMGLEWFALPQMCVAAGGATRLALGMADALAAHPARIAATFRNDRELMLAEAAVFALAERMPRPEAQALVTEAAKTIGEGTLTEALAARVPEVDWPVVLDPVRLTGDAPRTADAFIVAVEAAAASS